AETIAGGHLTFHADNTEAIEGTRVVMIALPTPPTADGSANLDIIEGVLRELADSLDAGTVVVMKSTIPVGSTARFQTLLDDLGADVSVVSNPEFLREGSAVDDFFQPDRIVIGSRSAAATAILLELYNGISAPIVTTDPPSSEMIKYASNAYLATRVTFANALAILCESVGADASVVLDGMGKDRRIGNQFLKPGPGFGGSCFPKDTKALVSIADDAGYDFSLLRGVIEINELQMHRIADKVAATVATLDGARVGLWGLAFKAGTGDTRESPALRIAEELAARGATVVAYDPAVRIDDMAGIEAADDALGAVRDADVLLIATEWHEFTEVDLKAVSDAMRGTAIVDARNLLEPSAVRELGMSYQGVGR
ncbi:MAG: UDP-glucose/GDP-mannose dehydrogenase family protein, partial [Actinomycetota bacterium]|nr:UDP-glucose/GDP-mannose dehydrogenase family protein [Actinomycetota bacterium]